MSYPKDWRIVTIKEVEDTVAGIEAEAPLDYERAHIMEDNLYERVLQEVVHSSPSRRLKLIAQAALESKKINFDRHCA